MSGWKLFVSITTLKKSIYQNVKGPISFLENHKKTRFFYSEVGIPIEKP